MSFDEPVLAPLLHSQIKKFIQDEQKRIVAGLRNFGSPFHIIFPQLMLENIQSFRSVFSKYETKGQIYFACKANKSPSFLQTATSSGIGVEVSSIYELKRALANGISGNNIIVSGSGKSMSFLFLATCHHCLLSVDDIDEIVQLHLLLNRNKISTAEILIRVNDIADLPSRFGILQQEIPRLYQLLSVNPSIKLRGFSFHINNYSVADRVTAIDRMVIEICKARENGHACDVIDIGGGFTINYVGKKDWDTFQNHLASEKKRSNLFFKHKIINKFYPYHSHYAKENFLEKILISKTNQGIAVQEMLQKSSIRLFIEPGRSLLDQCGITVAQVIGIKKFSDNENIVLVDANINHLSEQWFNTDYLVDPILLKENKDDEPTFVASVGGNLCLEMDMLSWRKIRFKRVPVKGDILVYPNTAGYQMDSNESSFHQIPLPRKICAYFLNNVWYQKNDELFSWHDIESEET